MQQQIFMGKWLPTYWLGDGRAKFPTIQQSKNPTIKWKGGSRPFRRETEGVISKSNYPLLIIHYSLLIIHY